MINLSCAQALPILGAGLLSMLPLCLPSAVQAAVCAADLDTELAAIAALPDFQHSRIGVLVETQGQTGPTQQTLYSRDAHQFFLPASNNKLLTSAAALIALGPDYRIRTSVYGQKSSDGSTVLQVVGRGDPTLNRDSLNALAQQLQQQDIHHIHQLVAVDSYFAGSPVHPNWEWEDVQSGYGAPANSLILDFNAVELTLWPQAVGEPLQVVWDNPAMTNQWQVINRSRTAAAGTANSATVGRDLSRPVLHVSGQLAVDDEPDAFAVAVPNPAEHFVQQFQAVLNQHDIEVEQTSVTSQPVAPLPVELATLRSPPLSELLVAVNRDSDNLYAEVLLKTLGQLYEPQLPQPQDAQAPVPDASEAGSQVAIAILEQLGVDPTEVVMVDGSGLSRHNLVTPHAIVDTLQAMADHAHGDIYRQSLAVAGTSGTLRYRFRETPVEGRLYGKTGTLTGNVTLSGYLNPPQYDPLVFSIMVNNSSQRTRQSRQLIDQMVQVLIQLTHC